MESHGILMKHTRPLLVRIRQITIYVLFLLFRKLLAHKAVFVRAIVVFIVAKYQMYGR